MTQRREWWRWLVPMVFAGVTLGCNGPVGTLTPAVTAGKNALGIVRFPDRWTSIQPALASERSGVTGTLIIYGRFEARSAGDELLLGVRSVEGYASDNHVAVAADGSFRVRAASADDWKNAQPIRLHDENVVEFDASQHYRERVPMRNGWKNANLKATGIRLERAMPSPDATMIALLSITETERRNENFLGSYSRGTVYLDLYNTVSGERVAAAETTYSGSAGDIGFSEATWIGDRAFVVPVDFGQQACFLAIRPRAK